LLSMRCQRCGMLLLARGTPCFPSINLTLLRLMQLQYPRALLRVSEVGCLNGCLMRLSGATKRLRNRAVGRNTASLASVAAYPLTCWWSRPSSRDKPLDWRLDWPPLRFLGSGYARVTVWDASWRPQLPRIWAKSLVPFAESEQSPAFVSRPTLLRSGPLPLHKGTRLGGGQGKERSCRND
jgi:hypothetical protein